MKRYGGRTSTIRRGARPLVTMVTLIGATSIGACLVSTEGLQSDGQLDASVVDAPAPFDAPAEAAPLPDTGAPDGDAAVDAAMDGDAAMLDAQMDAGPDASPYTKLILADTPFAYWPLDEVAGSNVAIDIVGGQSASAQGTVTFGVGGVSGTAVRFVGSQLSAGDYFDVLGQDPFAIEFWCKTDANDAGYQNMISKRAGAGQNGYVIYGVNGPVMQFEENWTNDAGQQRGGWGSVDFAAAYVHVVLTLDVANHVHFYVNGSEATKEFDAVGGPTPNGIALTFGGGMTGELDEIALYKHTLSAVQVNAHFHAGRP